MVKRNKVANYDTYIHTCIITILLYNSFVFQFNIKLLTFSHAY